MRGLGHLGPRRSPDLLELVDIKDIPVAKSSAEKPMSFKEKFKASEGQKTFKWTSPRTGKTDTYSTLTGDDKAAGKTKWDASSKEWVAPKKATPKKSAPKKTTAKTGRTTAGPKPRGPKKKLTDEEKKRRYMSPR